LFVVEVLVIALGVAFFLRSRRRSPFDPLATGERAYPLHASSCSLSRSSNNGLPTADESVRMLMLLLVLLQLLLLLLLLRLGPPMGP
jgi:hypothetical protein